MSDDFRGAGGQFKSCYLLNVWRKSSVLSLRLNPLIELQCNVSESNEFQTEGAQHPINRLDELKDREIYILCCGSVGPVVGEGGRPHDLRPT